MPSTKDATSQLDQLKIGSPTPGMHSCACWVDQGKRVFCFAGLRSCKYVQAARRAAEPAGGPHRVWGMPAETGKQAKAEMPPGPPRAQAKMIESTVPRPRAEAIENRRSALRKVRTDPADCEAQIRQVSSFPLVPHAQERDFRVQGTSGARCGKCVPTPLTVRLRFGRCSTR